MTIKKTRPTVAKITTPASANGGAAIADRLKLDASPPAPKSSKSTTWAFAFGLVALAVSGILTYMLYQHWEFLMPQ